MALGIDPKNDYAFKCVFGSEKHTRVLVHLLNAVLKPSAGAYVESAVILNPKSEPLKLDDKISILDIRARDQSGRQFNVEMQMASHPGLRGRFLYYWAKLYSEQMQSGEEYDTLNPVISICFLDWRLFPQSDAFHLPFKLYEPQAELVFSDHLALHIFQLPNFTKGVEDLGDSLDIWLYFLNNGEGLSLENLPEPMRISEVEEAMSVLKALTQEELERQRYFDREMARQDALSRRAAMEKAETRAAKAEAEAAKAKAEAAKAKAEAAKSSEKGRIDGWIEGLIGQVRLCEELLGRPPLPTEQLEAMQADELEELVAQLRSRKDG